MAKLNREDFISALKEMSILEIKELVDFMLMGCWGARIIIAYKSDYEFWVTVGVMAFFTVASLYGLKEITSTFN